MARLALLLALALPALAQGLTEVQARLLDRLAEEALKADPAYLQALADLEASRQTLGILGAVSAEVGASLAGEYGQVAPSYRLALSLNLADLFRDRGPALRALEARQTSYGVSYEAPSGAHDDTVMALALAVWAARHVTPTGGPYRVRGRW
jgi:hypothetical protein